MERSLEAKVIHAVEAWLAWLPRWRPANHRGRVRVCPRCFGSPVVRAAGLELDVPHAVQHGLTTRIRSVVEDAVDAYTLANLPSLHRELADAEQRDRRRYRPEEGLPPEFAGLPIDPEPEPGEPFLFTLAQLAEESAAPPEQPRPLDEREREQLRREIRMADDCARDAGVLACGIIRGYRPRIRADIDRFIEPQVAALLADLSTQLDSPPSPG